jgi:hypothetical protein
MNLILHKFNALLNAQVEALSASNPSVASFNTKDRGCMLGVKDGLGTFPTSQQKERGGGME